MISFLFRRLRYYWKNYLLKAFVFFFFFVSINIIGYFAASFSQQMYENSGNYLPSVSYSTQFTNLGETTLETIRNDYSEENYCFGYSGTCTREKDRIRFTAYYEGNIQTLGMIFENFYALPISSSISVLSLSSNPVLVSDNIEGSNVETEGGSYEINCKARFSLPSFFNRQFQVMGIRNVQFVFLPLSLKDGPFQFPTSAAVNSTDERLAEMGLVQGNELNSSYQASLSGISILFYLAFGIPYLLSLAFWTTLIRRTDLISRKELELFRSFGYSKGKAFRLFLGENLVLMVPGFLVSEIIFLPIFITVLHSYVLLSLSLTLFALLYFLLYCLWYSGSVVRHIYLAKGGKQE